MKVRRAYPEDVDAIFEVRTSVRENHMTEQELAEIGVTRESTRQAIINNSMPIWCAFNNEQLIGFSSIKVEDSELFALFVHPEHEGKGAGSMLHDIAANWWFRNFPEKPLNLNTSRKARSFSFYQKREWVEVEGEPKPHMEEGDVFMQLTVKQEKK